jgi:hypothetical protein
MEHVGCELIYSLYPFRYYAVNCRGINVMALDLIPTPSQYRQPQLSMLGVCLDGMRRMSQLCRHEPALGKPLFRSPDPKS